MSCGGEPTHFSKTDPCILNCESSARDARALISSRVYARYAPNLAPVAVSDLNFIAGYDWPPPFNSHFFGRVDVNKKQLRAILSSHTETSKENYEGRSLFSNLTTNLSFFLHFLLVGYPNLIRMDGSERGKLKTQRYNRNFRTIYWR